MMVMKSRTFVTWYYRRAASAKDSDLTDYFAGVAGLKADALQAGPELKLTRRSDPQCGPPESIWPRGVRNRSDAETCSRQPQLGGICKPSGGPCYFGCLPGETPPCAASCKGPGRQCREDNGEPKYGDYNGNACVGRNIFAAWASGTPPAAHSRRTMDGGIRLYSVRIPSFGPP